MKLPTQTVAAALGLALAALGLSDLGFVLLTHAPWVPHASSEVGLIGLGVGLIWWARRPTAGGRSQTSDRSPAGAAVVEVPDRANAVIAVALGSVLLLIGATVGLLFSLVFGALRGIEVFLAPWGVAGGIAVGVGASRLVSIHRSEQATDRAWIAIARTAGTSSPVAGAESAASGDAARLLSLHHEAVEAVRQAYETSLPSLRASVQIGVGLFLFVGLYLAWSLVTGAAAHLLPLPSVVNDALTVAAAAFLAFAGGAQSLARLRALELARVELRAGRAPAEWAVGGSIPF
ncbi:MAG TPA: hypothetical protein VGS18_05390, partial [Thermoplasmata archaeon]|nr:hypothetical protein [Thermoplasmata archaeon]